MDDYFNLYEEESFFLYDAVTSIQTVLTSVQSVVSESTSRLGKASYNAAFLPYTAYTAFRNSFHWLFFSPDLANDDLSFSFRVMLSKYDFLEFLLVFATLLATLGICSFAFIFYLKTTRKAFPLNDNKVQQQLKPKSLIRKIESIATSTQVNDLDLLQHTLDTVSTNFSTHQSTHKYTHQSTHTSTSLHLSDTKLDSLPDLSGAENLTSGTDNLTSGTDNLTSGTDNLTSGTNNFKSGADNLKLCTENLTSRADNLTSTWAKEISKHSVERETSKAMEKVERGKIWEKGEIIRRSQKGETSKQAFCRTISFSGGANVKPAAKKRRILPTKTKQPTTRSDKKPKSSPPGVPTFTLPDSKPDKSPFFLVGPRKSKPMFKFNKSPQSGKTFLYRPDPLAQYDRKWFKSGITRTRSNLNPKTNPKLTSKRSNTFSQNDAEKARSLSLTSKSDGILPKKSIHENKLKLSQAKKKFQESYAKKKVYSRYNTGEKVYSKINTGGKVYSKYNAGAYVMSHEGPSLQGQSQNAVFATSGKPVSLYNNPLIRPEVTRDPLSSGAEIFPPRKTHTPEIKSLIGLGAFRPLFKDASQYKQPYYAETSKFNTQMCAGDTSAETKTLKSDGAFLKPKPNYDFKFGRTENSVKISTADTSIASRVKDVNVNSLRSIWHDQTVTHHTAHDVIVSNRLDRNVLTQSLYGAIGQQGLTSELNDSLTLNMAGVRKQNLNFSLPSRPRRYRDVITGVKGGVKDRQSSSSSSLRSRSSKRLSNSSIRHALETGLVKTRHPLKPTATTANKDDDKVSPGHRFSVSPEDRLSISKLERLLEGDVNERILQYLQSQTAILNKPTNHKPTNEKSSNQSPTSDEDKDQNISNRDEIVLLDKQASQPACKCFHLLKNPNPNPNLNSVNTATFTCSLIGSSSTDDSRTDTCRLCEKVTRPVTSHRHKPYGRRAVQFLRKIKLRKLDRNTSKHFFQNRNNHSPSKRRHFFLVSQDDDVTSLDSDYPSEMDVRRNAGVNSRHVIIPSLSRLGHRNQHLGVKAGVKPSKTKSTKRESPKFKVTKFVSKGNSPFGVFTGGSKLKDTTDRKSETDKHVPEVNSGGQGHFFASPNTYSDYIRFCRSKVFQEKSTSPIAAESTGGQAEKRFSFLNREQSLRETIPYSSYLRHRRSTTLGDSIHSTVIGDSVAGKNDSEGAKNTKGREVKGTEITKEQNSSLKHAEVQTSPDLMTSTSQKLSNPIPKVVCNQVNRQIRRRNKHVNKSKNRKLSACVSRRKGGQSKQCSMALESNNKQYESLGEIPMGNQETTNFFTNQPMTPLSAKNRFKETESPRQEQPSREEVVESDGSSTALNMTYTIESEEELDAREEERDARPVASPRKSTSPNFSDRFMQRPMWQNADVNELDRRIQRALKLREELQRLRQNKNNATTTRHLIQKLEEGGLKKEEPETCTEDLRPSDTDEIPSLQLDSSANDPTFLVTSADKKMEMSLPGKSYRPEGYSPTSTNASTVILNDSHNEGIYSTTENIADVTMPVLLGVDNQDSSLLEQKNSFVYQRLPCTNNDAENIDLAGAVCLDILTDELEKIEKRNERHSSTIESTHPSLTSVNTSSMLTESISVTRQANKKNTPPVKISKSDNETCAKNLRLIGELVQGLPKVPTQSIVDWFLATSDPRDFERLSKSGLSSNSSENDVTKNEKNPRAEKPSPLPKSRQNTPQRKSNNSIFTTPPSSKLPTPNPYTNQPTANPYNNQTTPKPYPNLYRNTSNTTQRESLVPRRQPSRRFQKVKDRKTPLRPSRGISGIKNEVDNTQSTNGIFSSQYFAQTTASPKPEDGQQMTKPEDGDSEEMFHRVRPKNRSVSRHRPTESKPGRTLSQPRRTPPTPSRNLSQPPRVSVYADHKRSPGLQEIVNKLRRRNSSPNSPTSPASDFSPPADNCKITIKKKSDIKGIIARFSNR